MAMQFWHGLQNGPILDAFSEIIDAWNSKNQTKVEPTAFSDYGEPVRKSLSASSEERPHIVLVPEYQTSTMLKAMQEKKVVPIHTLIGEKQLEDIAKIVRYTFGDREGNLFGLPFNPSCGVIFTNQEMLEAVGKDPRYVPDAIEDLEAVAQELIEKELTEFGYTCAWPAAYLAEIPAAQQDVALVVPENGRLGYGEYRFSQEYLRNHLLDIRRQQEKGIFHYAGRYNDSRQLFIEKKVAFFMQGAGHYKTITVEAPFTVGCGPLPSLVRNQKEKYAFPIGGAAIWVFDTERTLKILSDIKAFLNYLVDEKTQEIWHKNTAYVPVNHKLLEQLDFYKEHPLHNAVVVQTLQAPMGRNSFNIQAPNYDIARKELFEVIEKVINVTEKGDLRSHDTTTSENDIEAILQAFDQKYTSFQEV